MALVVWLGGCIAPDPVPEPTDALDDDGDGLTNGEERALGTDPRHPDTDRDTLLDGVEVELGTDPLARDTDQDRLDDGVEIELGTNPLDPDTDGGRALDGAELGGGTDPFDPTDDEHVLDDDQDGLSNALEAALRTDPSDPDTDRDTLLDGAEVYVYGTDPLLLDTDGDLVADGLEVREVFTDPLLRDTDGGGADDGLEVLEPSYATDPHDPSDDLKHVDTDRDGLSDWHEVTWRTLPLDPDYDHDGVKDGVEVYLLGTDPRAPDSDGGGLTDGEEVARERDPNDASDDASLANTRFWFDPFDQQLAPFWADAWREDILPDPLDPQNNTLKLDDLAYAQTSPVDVSSCGLVRVEYDVMASRVVTGDVLRLEADIDGSRTVLHELQSKHAPEGRWQHVTVEITDAELLSERFELYLGSTLVGRSGDYYVDDFGVTCDPDDRDDDGDGAPNWLDCDDSDPGVRAACGWCVDLDGDGFGFDCERGEDCRDHTASTNPDAADPWGDFFDTDCSRSDGPGLYDGFEAPAPDAAVWTGQEGLRSSVDPIAGAHAVGLGGGALLGSRARDLRSCPSLAYRVDLQQRELDAAPSSAVALEYFDGTDWVGLTALSRGDHTRPAHFEGNLADAGARHADLQLRLVARGGDPHQASYAADELWLGCGAADADGDGYDATHDCDDDDARSWAECARCIDGDGDGYGLWCDLGPDCDDGDIDVHPGAPDVAGDQLDADCSGDDGPGWGDTFSGPSLMRGLWRSTRGDVDDGGATGPLTLTGPASIRTQGLDASTCDTVQWSITTEASSGWAANPLVIEVYDGASWQLVRELSPGEASGAIPRATGANLAQLELRLRTPALTSDVAWSVHELSLHCGGADADADGIPDDQDCAPDDPLQWSRCDTCVDLDGDGAGVLCDLGLDCRDDDPAVHTGAADPVGDDIDQDCDGIDGQAAFHDRFERTADTERWASVTGSWATIYLPPPLHDLGLSLRLGTDVVLTSRAFDTSMCDSVAWSFWVAPGLDDAGPNPDDMVQVSLRTSRGRYGGSDVVGVGRVGTWQRVTGFGGPELADRSLTLELRVTSHDGYPYNDFDVLFDGLSVGCTSGDADGDGVAAGPDCDDSDADLWARCETCIDADGDGFGEGCDRGPDCDDEDATVSPGQVDVWGDGVDADCSGVDGPGWVDSFEHVLLDERVWDLASLDGPVLPVALADGGEVGLGLYGTTVETRDVDTRDCDTVGVKVSVAEGSVALDWWDGTAWQGLGTLEATAFRPLAGHLDDAAAFSEGFRIRVRAPLGSAVIDEAFVGCAGADGDGDGVPYAVDCDDADDGAWYHCAFCVDDDSDRRGLECDLGSDCDDLDDTTHVGALDEVGDGVDQDCSGLDGVDLYDDFEAVERRSWNRFAGDRLVRVHWSADNVVQELADDDFELVTVPLAFEGCSAVDWSYEVQRTVLNPEVGDELVVAWWDGRSWVEVDRLGGGVIDSTLLTRGGTLTSPAATADGFQMRWWPEGDWTFADRVYIDDVNIGCVP